MAEAEQTPEANRESQPKPEQDLHGNDRQNSTAPGQENPRDTDRRPDDASRTPVEVGRSDPPQQHVPRLHQIELEIEERHERDRDDRER